MRYRKLRIAWSVLCGIACVMLCVLWVRSYWQWDEFTLNDGVSSLGSKSGGVYLFRSEIATYPSRPYSWPGHSGGEITKPQNAFKWQPPFGQRMGVSFPFPYWFPVAMSAGLATMPWLRWCFSLRTLLIATTLAAVVLGLGVYVARK